MGLQEILVESRWFYRNVRGSPRACCPARRVLCSLNRELVDGRLEMRRIWMAIAPCERTCLRRRDINSAWLATQCRAALEKTRSEGAAAVQVGISPLTHAQSGWA